ncbi:MAG: hypothetical protein IKL44_03235 [Clostridia bacterium]|nr:hypothetical protein [Clostridia bacterium]
MKKTLAIVLALILCLGLTACGGGGGKKEISGEIIAETVSTFKYTVSGVFSSPLGTLLNQASPDYKVTYAPYSAVEEEIDDQWKEYIEENDYTQYLSNTYLVTVTGSVRENPQIPSLMTDVQEIIKLLCVYDEEDNLVMSAKYAECKAFNTFAVLYLCSY